MVAFTALLLVLLPTTLLASPTALFASPTALSPTAHASRFTLILSDLADLDNSIKDLTLAINAYTSGVTATIPILLGVQTVNATNRKAYFDAQTLAVQTLPDSLLIAQYVADPIAVDIPNSLAALKKKKQPLVEAGLRGQILDGLNLLLGDHETLTLAIAAKLNPGALVVAGVPATTIDLAIREGIVEFSV